MGDNEIEEIARDLCENLINQYPVTSFTDETLNLMTQLVMKLDGIKEMTPNWKDAPEWANWVAMDSDGDWYWYQNEPFLVSNTFWLTGSGLFKFVDRPEYTQTKEQRPKL